MILKRMKDCHWVLGRGWWLRSKLICCYRLIIKHKSFSDGAADRLLKHALSPKWSGILVLWVNFFFSRLNLVQMHIFLCQNKHFYKKMRRPFASVHCWHLTGLCQHMRLQQFVPITSGSFLVFEFLSHKSIGESTWEPLSFSALVN